MPKKTKGQITKEMILTKAIELFSEKGFEQTSTQEIADVCGLSQTNIFYHFKNKKGLFSAIVDFVIANNREIFFDKDHSHETPWEKFESLLYANIIWAKEFPAQAQVLLSLFHFSGSDNDMKELATKTIDNGRALTKKYLEELDEEIILIDEKSIFIQQWIMSVIFQMISRSDPDEIFKTFEVQCQHILKSIIF